MGALAVFWLCVLEACLVNGGVLVGIRRPAGEGELRAAGTRTAGFGVPVVISRVAKGR